MPHARLPKRIPLSRSTTDIISRSLEPKGDRVERLENEAVVFKHVVANLTRQIAALSDRSDAALPPQAPETEQDQRQRIQNALAPAPNINEMVRKVEAKFGYFDILVRTNIVQLRFPYSPSGEQPIHGANVLSALEAAAKRSEG